MYILLQYKFWNNPDSIPGRTRDFTSSMVFMGYFKNEIDAFISAMSFECFENAFRRISPHFSIIKYDMCDEFEKEGTREPMYLIKDNNILEIDTGKIVFRND